MKRKAGVLAWAALLVAVSLIEWRYERPRPVALASAGIETAAVVGDVCAEGAVNNLSGNYPQGNEPEGGGQCSYLIGVADYTTGYGLDELQGIGNMLRAHPSSARSSARSNNSNSISACQSQRQQQQQPQQLRT